jgi:Rrf2 family protein
MKFSSQEEYGLRCLLRLGQRPEGLTIPEISRLEGLSLAYVGKLMRVLRTSGFVISARGAAGGYQLARAPECIPVGEVLAVLGGRLYEPHFCIEHSGDSVNKEKVCTHSVNCSLRSLWRTLQLVIDQVLDKTTLRDLMVNETEMTQWVEHLVTVGGLAPPAEVARS